MKRRSRETRKNRGRIGLALFTACVLTAGTMGCARGAFAVPETAGAESTGQETEYAGMPTWDSLLNIQIKEETMAAESPEEASEEEITEEETTEEESSEETTEETTEEATEETTEEAPAEEWSIADTWAAQSSGQIITVVSNGDATAELCRWEKRGDGTWVQRDSTFAFLGSGGMKYGPSVYNWDMCTPTGSYSLTEAFGLQPDPGTALPYRQLDGSECWVDDETSPLYNTMQFGDPDGRWNSAEHLASFGTSYHYSIVVDYNRWPVDPGGSSAIFLHVTSGAPTWGCIAIDEGKMIETLTWIDPAQNPRILLGFSYEEIFTSY